MNYQNNTKLCKQTITIKMVCIDSSFTIKLVRKYSRARWYEHGERSSKYFYNLEKRN